jgi:hypothetical protein
MLHRPLPARVAGLSVKSYRVSETFIDYQSFLNPPTDAQVDCLKNSFRIYIKIYIKTAPTCFGAVTIIRERVIRAC